MKLNSLQQKSTFKMTTDSDRNFKYKHWMQYVGGHYFSCGVKLIKKVCQIFCSWLKCSDYDLLPLPSILPSSILFLPNRDLSGFFRILHCALSPSPCNEALEHLEIVLLSNSLFWTLNFVFPQLPTSSTPNLSLHLLYSANDSVAVSLCNNDTPLHY